MITKEKVRPLYQRLLDEELERVILAMNRTMPDSAEYAKMLSSVERLYEMKETKTSTSVSKDTLAIVGANLVGIFMILKHEFAHPITSKALSFVLRPR